jgi:Putative F0F1-ATPase subunit Ca2+/Mg2+ transporter
MALTIAADLVGGVVGGAAVGWLIDRWTGAAPWGMISLFFLGAAAGMWNVYRTVRGFDMSLGFHQTQAHPKVNRDEMEIPAGARPDNEGGDQRGQSTPSISGRADHPHKHRRD